MPRSASTAARVAGVVEARQQLARRRVVAAALHGERALPRRGQELHRLEQLGRLVEPPEACEARRRQHDCVVLAARHLAEARVDVAADRRRPRCPGAACAAAALAAASRCQRAHPRAARRAAVRPRPPARRAGRHAAGSPPASAPRARRWARPSASARRSRPCPSSSACSTARTKTPRPPISVSGELRSMSPSVLTRTSSISRPGCCARRASATSSLCTSARRDPRVARRSRVKAPREGPPVRRGGRAAGPRPRRHRGRRARAGR